MGKRFGRNQKRKMREKIQALEGQNRSNLSMLSSETAKADKYQRRLEDMIEEFQRWVHHSIILPAGVVNYDSKRFPPYYQLTQHPRYRPYLYEEEPVPMEIISQTLEMINVVCRMEDPAAPSHNTMCTHVVLGSKGTFQYYVDLNCLTAFGDKLPRHFIKNIASKITHEMEKLIIEEGIGGKGR